MTRALVTSLVFLVGLAAASGAGAREFRFFDIGDRVYYQDVHQNLEPISEPHVYLPRAQRAFAKGHRSVAALNLEKAAAGFNYFSDRAAGENRRQLDLASRALGKLARDLRRGEVDEVTTLERAIADAQRVLAGEHAPPAAPVGPPAPESPDAAQAS